MRLGSDQFWPHVVNPVEMAGAVDFLMAHKDPFNRVYLGDTRGLWRLPFNTDP